jgi:prepilin-type N-terminal cleavage/methylation domain-containing protein
MMRRLRAGFSFIEMLFAMVILAVVCGGVSTLFFSNTFGADLSGDQSTAMGDAQTALRSMAIDSRPGSAFAAPTNTGGVRVTFSSGSPIEYYQSGTTLDKLVDGTTPTTTTVVTDLASGTGLSVTYYDSSMNAIAGPMDATKYGQAAVADVTVRITLAHSTLGQLTRTTRVVLRNKVS